MILAEAKMVTNDEETSDDQIWSKFQVNELRRILGSDPFPGLNTMMTSSIPFAPQSRFNDSLPSINEVPDGFGEDISIRSRHLSSSSTLQTDNITSSWNPAVTSPPKRHHSYIDHSQILPLQTSPTSDVFTQPIGGDYKHVSRSRAFSEGSLNLAPGESVGDVTANIWRGNPQKANQFVGRRTSAQQQQQINTNQFMLSNGQQRVGNGTFNGQQQVQTGSRYKTELCRPFEETNRCKYGEKCQFAHGKQELREMQRHPKYKTELCRTYHSNGYCPYGPRCHFIHEKHRETSSPPNLTSKNSLTNQISSTVVGNNKQSSAVLQEMTKPRVYSVPRPVPLTSNYYNSTATSPSSSYSPPGFEQPSITPPWAESNSGSPPSYAVQSVILTNHRDDVFITPPNSPSSDEKKPKQNRLSVFRSLSKTE